MSLKEREQAISAAVEELEQLDRVEDELRRGRRAQAERALERARAARLRTAPPVPVSLAARILDVSEPTVRDWAGAGILEDRGDRPQKVTLGSVLRVRDQLRELRALGKERSLRRALLARIDDELTARDPDVRRSLAHARSGGRRNYVHRRPAGVEKTH